MTHLSLLNNLTSNAFDDGRQMPTHLQKMTSQGMTQKVTYPAANLPIPLYTSRQVYAIEESWFKAGHDSYGLMQQAAWQMSQWIHSNCKTYYQTDCQPCHACIWVGSGNNGGDGWLIGHYLTQLGWQVSIIEVQHPATTDAIRAKSQAQEVVDRVIKFGQYAGVDNTESSIEVVIANNIDVHIDAMFGIGLDRAPKDSYRAAIKQFNRQINITAASPKIASIAVDIPSGLVASTGQVFEGLAIKADITLCLVARKLGLHIKDGMDYSGQIIDIPLIPMLKIADFSAKLLFDPLPLHARQHNTHKGSYGHVLIVGGNYIGSNEYGSNEYGVSQGMGGAAILSASTALASGAGKVTVACHRKFHQALVSCLPNAMCMDLVETISTSEGQNKHSLTALIRLLKECDSVALGMGLGRDELSYQIFCNYIKAIIQAEVATVIDADAIFHLASLVQKASPLAKKFKQYCQGHMVWFTPHSGEAARLLDLTPNQVEADKLNALHQLVEQFGGSWLLKGAGSLIYSNDETYVCHLGNAGMATAGMGDVLAGLAASLQAQMPLPATHRTLMQAVLTHALAGDLLAHKYGEWQLQAQHMPSAIGSIMQANTVRRRH